MNRILEGKHAKKELKKHAKFILNESPNPAPMAAVYGRMLRSRGLVGESEEILRWALGSNPKHVALLNEIGKLYHITGRHGESLKYLRRAGDLSPDNTKRLCLIGELELGEQRLESAERLFQKVLTLDPFYERAREGHQLVDAAKGYISENPQEAPTNSNFASFMNTIGINKVRSGRLDEGIKHYRTALNFIEDPHTKAKVMFNIALGYLRHSKVKEALLWFMRSSKSGLGMFEKADTYVEKLSADFVLTDDGGEFVEPPAVQEVDESIQQADSADAVGDEVSDDLDELNYDDFHEDIGDMPFADADGDSFFGSSDGLTG